MKITQVQTFNHPEFPNLIHLKVVTDSGIYGIGESYYFGKSVAAFIAEYAAGAIIGEDAREIEKISKKLTTYTGSLSSGIETRAKSAIDIALWDIAGKVANQPIYKLLGGASRSIPIYNTCAGSGYMRKSDQASTSWGLSADAGEYEDLHSFLTDAGGLAKQLIAEGIGGMKIWPFDTYAEKNNGKDISDEDLKAGLIPLQKVRQAVGDKINLMLELHALWSPVAAKKIFEATSDLNLTWIEDPIYPDLLDDYQMLRDKRYAPIAHGETISSYTRVKHLLEHDYIDVLTLDLGWCGGYTAGVEFAKLTTKYGKSIAPHDCTGPIGLISGTHLSTARDNAKVQETVRAALRSWYPKMVTQLPEISNGMIKLGDSSGLGTDLSQNFLTSPELITQTIK